MADPIVEGSAAHPVSLDPWHRVVEVGWGGGIGVLTVDMPEGVNLSFDPSGLSLMASKNVGEIVAKSDFAKFNDDTGEHPAPVSELIRPKIILSTLYGEGDKAWMVKKLLRSAGEDPGNHVDPSPFPPDEGLPPNSFPNGGWQEYRDFYNEQKTKFLHDNPEGRWIEVSDLKSLGSDTLVTGPPQIAFGPGETWAELNYGEIALYHFQLVPYVPPHYNIFFVQQYNTILGDPAGRAPGNIGYAPYGFNNFEAVRIAPWGLGEVEVNGNPGRKAIRKIYFFDFSVIKDDVIIVSNAGEPPDTHLPSGYNMVFVFRLFAGGAKFTLTETGVDPDFTATYNEIKNFPYTQAGVLFRVNKQGFVV